MIKPKKHLYNFYTIKKEAGIDFGEREMTEEEARAYAKEYWLRYEKVEQNN